MSSKTLVWRVTSEPKYFLCMEWVVGSYFSLCHICFSLPMETCSPSSTKN